MSDQIRTVAETGSTNADMLALAADGAPEGLWLRAERQTAGRGRLGRSWEGPAGNLYASTLVRLQPGDPPAATLALVAAVAAHEVLDAVLPGWIRIKWPNDLLVDRAKLAGILLERAGDAVVIGIGVNVTAVPEGLSVPATSLGAMCAVNSDAADLVVALAETFARWLGRWRGEGLAPVRAAWLAAAHPVGTGLATTGGDGARIEGSFDGLTDDGALILRLANGSTHVMHAGDVFLL